jgi:site-specific recombinase XerD
VSNKGKVYHPQALTTGEVEALMAACSPTSPTGKRNRALIVVLWRGALRCEEALQLRPYDLNRADGSIRIMHGKGRKARTVGIEPRAWAVLEVWLAAREELLAKARADGIDVPRDAPLFCVVQRPNTGKSLSSSNPRNRGRYVRWLMADLGRKADIGKRTAPHQLRHTRAAEAANEGVPVHMISVFLGHSNVGTTDRYIQHLNPRAAIDAMLASQWGQGSDG